MVATTGETLREDEEHAFERDSATDDTKMRTAVAWLEEAVLLTREENRVQVFPSSLQVSSVQDTERRLARASVSDYYRGQLLTICQALFEADADEGISTDELMMVTGLTPEGVRDALYDLEGLGIARNDTALTAFVHVGVERHSRRRLQEAAELEQGLIRLMQEEAPDMARGETSTLHLRSATQELKDDGHTHALPELLRRIVPEEVRMGLYAVQRGVCPGCGFHQPHHRRFDVDHIVALSDDGEDRVVNLQQLCTYCNRTKATQGSGGFRMKMAELRAHNVAESMMVDERLAEFTGRRLAQHHREIGQ